MTFLRLFNILQYSLFLIVKVYIMNINTIYKNANLFYCFWKKRSNLNNIYLQFVTRKSLLLITKVVNIVMCTQ